MQSHHGLHGIGNNHTNSHQAQFGRLRFPISSDSIPFTSKYVQLIPEVCKLTHYKFPPLLAFPQMLGDHPGAGFDKFLLHFRERVAKIAFDIQLTRQLFVH
jgi:hypothetical protein